MNNNLVEKEKYIDSHIYPKSMIKKWLIDILGKSNEFLKIYKIDLSTKTYDYKELSSEVDISKYLKEKDFFYFNLPEKYINYYEKEWEKTENNFYQIYNEIRKVMTNQKLSKTSIKKIIINNITKNKVKINKIIEFLILTLFRCNLYKPIFKGINASNENVLFFELSELMNSLNLRSINDLDSIHNKIKNEFKINEYDFYFYFGINTGVICNPPIFKNGNLIYIFPILGLGFVLLVKKGYGIKIENNTWEIIDNINNLSKENYDFKDCFVTVNNYFLDIPDFLQSLMVEFWLNCAGFKAGYLYWVCTDIYDKGTIDNIMEQLNVFGAFSKRNNYLNGDNFDENNTIWYI